eukprot:gene109-5521_t
MLIRASQSSTKSGLSIIQGRRLTLASCTAAITLRPTMPTKFGLDLFIQRAKECNTGLEEYDSFIPLSVGGKVVGRLRPTPTFADHLSRFPKVFDTSVASKVTVQEALGSPESRTEAVAGVLDTLRSEGVITGWRDELYPVERAAATHLGIKAYGVHVKWDKLNSPDDYDKVICAEIPDESEDPVLFNTVKACMMHGPCGTLNPNAPCMKDGACTKHYPKDFCPETRDSPDGYPVYRRRDKGRTVVSQFNNASTQLDNRWVVPYNPSLSRKFNCHINVEYCAPIRSVKYLYKYVYKGHDRAEVAFQGADGQPTVPPPGQAHQAPQQPHVDEIQRYQDGRYISASEAHWRLTVFPIISILIHDLWSTIQDLGSIVQGPGYVKNQDGTMSLWVAKRSKTKANWPGKLDHIAAGGQPHGISPTENVIKECNEEASIPFELARTAQPIGAVSYTTISKLGYKPDVLFCYDICLPADFTPEPQDGEVEEFKLMSMDQVAEIVATTTDFKTNCCLVIIDFMVRHGYITPEQPGYLELISLLRVGDCS